MRRDDYFVFGGMNSRDYGALLTDVRNEDTPERDVKAYSIPGRSGDLIVDNKRWGNTSVRYGVAILSGFMERFDAMKADMFSLTGYQRLEDTIRPNEYRMAMLRTDIQPDLARFNRTGQFSLTFNCKPQRFLKLGENAVSFESPGIIANPTGFPALPLISVYGNAAGTVTVGGVTVKVLSIADSITLDCDLQEAFRRAPEGAVENYNSSIYALEFPKLPKGVSEITWTGGIERVEIIPRWWKL